MPALDAFSTKYYPESERWIKSNLALEGIIPFDGNDQVEVVVEKLRYGKRFNFQDNSVDVVILPIGILIAYLSEVSSEPEKYANRMISLINEIYRILKLDGKFVSSNLIFMCGKFERILFASKFGADNINILLDDKLWKGANAIPEENKHFFTSTKWLWWSYIPAKMTIATKKPGTRPVVSEVTLSPMVVGSVDAIRQEEPALVSNDPDEDPVNEDDLRVQEWFPSGRHWRLVECLILLTFVVWILYVVLTWQCLVFLELPYFLPYDQQISALFISNANVLPFVIYLILARLRDAAVEAETEVRAQMKKEVSLTSFSPAEPHSVEVSNIICKRILKVYKGEMFDVVLLLTLNSGLGWLPYFILDTILIKSFGVQDSVVTNVNTIVSIIITVFFIRFLGSLVAWYSKIKDQQQKSQQVQTEEDTRVSMAFSVDHGPKDDERWQSTNSNHVQHFSVSSNRDSGTIGVPGFGGGAC